MIRVGVIGASGYTALELLKILACHPEVSVVEVTSRDPECPALDQVHPALQGMYDLKLGPLEIEPFADAVDVAFSCLPHAASAEAVAQLRQRDVRVIDFSADYRLNDVATFERWYGVTHPDADMVGEVAYGIPELFRDQIAGASLVANPGCFPSSVLLPLVPLIQSEMIETSGVIIDSKTGVTGAGRKANLRFHFPECNESVMAYGVGTHRHQPEINHLIQRATGESVEVLFTPHLIPMDRGILSTIYLQPKPGVDAGQVNQLLADRFDDEPFVRVVSQPPSTKQVAMTNFCDLYAVDVMDRIVIIAALDNLIKGASGAAVQNMNCMYGWPETMALGSAGQGSLS